MGKILIPPLKFILLFILSAAVFLAFSLIYNWGLWVSPATETRNSLLLFIPSTAFGVILPSITASLLFSFFSYRKSRINPVAALLTAAAVFIVIFFGFKSTSALKSSISMVSYQPFNERKLQTTDSGIIYTDNINESGLVKGIITRPYGSQLPGFRFYQGGQLIKGEHPELEISEGRSIGISPLNPVFHNVFEPESALGQYINDYGALNGFFRQAANDGGTSFLILTAVMTAFLMACMLFRGASVWPLFDFILILAFHRGVFYLFSLLTEESDFISETLFGGKVPGDIHLILLSICTLVIAVLGILFRITGKNSGRTA